MQGTRLYILPCSLMELTGALYCCRTHTFCKGCIEKSLKFDPYCPCCKTPLRTITGTQPAGGSMECQVLYYPVTSEVFEAYLSTIRYCGPLFLAMRVAKLFKLNTPFHLVCKVQNTPTALDIPTMEYPGLPICLATVKDGKFSRYVRTMLLSPKCVIGKQANCMTGFDNTVIILH